MAKQMSADAIAELFLARLPEGRAHMRLSVKQTNWLISVAHREELEAWHRESRRSGMSTQPPSSREASGLWHEGAWDLAVLPNGAGVISVR